MPLTLRATTVSGPRVSRSSAARRREKAPVSFDNAAKAIGAFERRLVTPGRFDAFLRGYIDRHAFQSITTETFAADLRANLIKGDQALAGRLQVEDWLTKVGMPGSATRISAVVDGCTST